jgi:hypothetical protein
MKQVLTILIVAIIFVSCGGNKKVQEEYLDVTIDSISVHQRYTTIPSDYYHYHTSAGIIPTNNLNHKVGDELSVKIIKYVK